ncbi:pantetheinase [Nephila pilipes]|uniref:Pantetheinase n=1 Tax=Nephila pilipes TaxID=299642 RepID=A0A8X6NIQ2_NEPPI|nr:pantetheinase [Nephila pilipes]
MSPRIRQATEVCLQKGSEAKKKKSRLREKYIRHRPACFEEWKVFQCQKNFKNSEKYSPRTRNMKRILDVQLFFTVILCLLVSGFAAGHNYYRAAVLETVRFSDVSRPPKEVVKRNLDIYEAAVKTASENEVDIIVFPECGIYPAEKVGRSVLRTFVEDIPDPKKGSINPCSQTDKFRNHPILTKLSCLAKEHNIYIVANTVDFKKCKVADTCDADGIDTCTSEESKCPSDGNYFYNTNIVFDRKGTLVSRYYKKHLYFEKSVDMPDFPQDATFHTDFGNFTTVICFDLIFKESVEDVKKPGIVNLAYPTYWYDHVPFVFFSTPYQQAWALTNKVNLLAANGHMPKTGTVGSGIYSAHRGALVYTHNPDFRTKLLISNVPRSVSKESANSVELNVKKFFLESGAAIEVVGEEERNFKSECTTNVLGEAKDTMDSYRCKHSPLDDYEFFKLEGDEGTQEICSNGFCCSLSYQAHSMDEDYFLAVSGKPLTYYDTFLYGIQSCFLARCRSLDGHPCKQFGLKSRTVFQKVDLKANFTTRHIYPFALDSDVRLTNKRNWSFDGKSQIHYENLGKKSSLTFFGLHGRLYDDDKLLT